MLLKKMPAKAGAVNSGASSRTRADWRLMNQPPGCARGAKQARERGDPSSIKDNRLDGRGKVMGNRAEAGNSGGLSAARPLQIDVVNA